jgi:hypothetical protein
MNSSPDPDETTVVGAGEPRSSELAHATTLVSREPGSREPGAATTIGLDAPNVGIRGPTPTVQACRPTTADDCNVPAPAAIGRYKVELLLGEGGFGQVYLVLDEQLERRVAAKVPHRRLVPDLETAASYLAEARAAACLDHPNVVPVSTTLVARRNSLASSSRSSSRARR